MSEYPHIIQRQVWKIECSSKEEYQIICQYLQEELTGEIGELLEKTLSHFFPPDQYVEIDQLHIDLGDISFDELEYELIGRFQSGLKKALEETIFQKKNIIIREGISENTWKAFEYFLLHGYAPWWVPLAEKGILINKYDSLIQKFPQLIARFFRYEGKKEAVRKRLIYQLGDPAVRNTIRILEPSHAPYLETYADDLLLYHRHRPLVNITESNMVSIIWEIILTYLLAERGSTFNTFSFARSSLKQLASRYNISFRGLLKTMYEQLPSLIPKSNLGTNLAFVVEYLLKETSLNLIDSPSSKSNFKISDNWKELFSEK